MIFDINQERVDKKFPDMRTRKGSATSGSFFSISRENMKYEKCWKSCVTLVVDKRFVNVGGCKLSTVQVR